MTRRTSRLLAVAALACLPDAGVARGQVIIIDRRPHVPIARSYEVREVAVDARIRDQVAEVRVSQTFHNPGSAQLEAEFLFPLPEDGAIQDFVLLVDGRELPGRLMPKDEARRIYEEIVRTKRDPALLEYMGRGLFKTSVFPIPPGAERKVTMRYTKLLRRERDVVEFVYPFATQKFTSKPIESLTLNVEIESKDPIKSVYSPSHEAERSQPDDHHARARLHLHDVTPATDFKLLYTLAEGRIGANVLSYRPSSGDDGFFLLLASPEVKKADRKPQPKTVVLALDRSGSMSGKKIEQAREALRFVLDNLREDDTFNIIAYDDRVETYKPELQRYSSEARADAVRYIDNIRPGGSTNIDGALKAALDLLHKDDRPQYVLFLTDGLPTAGETRETAIAEHVRESNDTHARLFVFGVGHDVNARLLDRISGNNGGASEYVRPDEDIEANVSRFYSKLTSPVLTDIRVRFDHTDINRTYPRDLPDLFEGGQIAWVGRYTKSGRAEVEIKGKVDGDRQTLRIDADLADPGEGSRYDFVERLWAVRRIGFIIDQVDLHGQNKELTDELVELSTRYGILTPYTSFLADERVGVHDRAANVDRARRSLESLSEVQGPAGVGQRQNKQDYMAATRAPGLSNAPAPTVVATAPQQAGQAARSEARLSATLPGAAPAAGSIVAGRAVAKAESRFGSMGGMMGGGAGFGMKSGQMATEAMMAPARGALPAIARDEAGKSIAVGNVRQLGKKTFYLRNHRWVDSEVKPEDEAKAIAIEQFSDRYFALAGEQDAERNQYLTFDEPVTVKLGTTVYRIDPPSQ